MKCSIRAMLIPERYKSIVGECVTWLIFTMQLVFLSALVLAIVGAGVEKSDVVLSCGVFASMVLWLEDLHKYPFKSGAGNYGALETDGQIHERNHRYQHSFRMKFTPVILMVAIYYASAWISKLAIVSAFIDLF